MPAQQSLTARKRLIAAAAGAVLALGGLTACGLEEPTVTKAPASDAKEAGEDAKGKQKKESTGQADGQLAAGDTANYDSGLRITVSEATPYTPGEFSIGHTEGNKAYKLTVTLENSGAEKVNTTLITLTARAGEDGVEAEQIFDDTVGEGFDGNLLPGKKATAEYAFDAPADAKNLDVEVDPLDFTSEAAQWGLTL
ncbi:DUF4352 domain-containing protein [Streptomyces megasporus]|uniref:DUF4352 domain-containing protein n=1 Tax=Streptomyces megasporus TaxID=44060 RepID=UPI0004E1AD4F|nr:DUF4352 domain-containing protein [Streptomyces megasporus]